MVGSPGLPPASSCRVPYSPHLFALKGDPPTSLNPSGKLPCFPMLNLRPPAPHTLSIPLCIPCALSNICLLQPVSISLQRVTH